MAEEKFASLSSGLLARKGAAKPAMRRQGYMNPQGDVADDLGWNDMGYAPPQPIESNGSEFHAAEPPAIHEQIGRISEGFGIQEEEAEEEFEELEEAPGLDGHAGLSAMDERDELADAGDDTAEDYAEAAEAAAPEPVEAEEQAPGAEVIPMRPTAPEPAEERVPARDKVAFTLRLDKQRHLKLRLASALENRSAQQLVTEALDTFFKAMPDLDRLTANSRDRH